MRKIFSWHLLLLLTIGSCEIPNTVDSGTLTPEKIEINVTEAWVTDSLISPRVLFTDVEYIPLGSPDKFFLTEAKKILEMGNKVFILDANKKVVVAYDLQGNFINQVGKKGLGPEEYQTVMDIMIAPKRNSLLIFSAEDQSILEFDSDLAFKRKIRFNVFGLQASVLESGNIAFYSYFDQEGKNILIYDWEGQQVGGKMPYPQGRQYIPMDFSGSMCGNYYTYPLSSVIYKLEEFKENDTQAYEIFIPDMWPENKKFKHTEFVKGPYLAYNILSKFVINGNDSSVLFYYSYKEKGLPGFTLGARLASGQVFGHLNLKHGENNYSDPFVKLFFTGPYNLPTYNSSSGYYYMAPTNESLNGFFANRNAGLKEIKKIDYDLYKILEGAKDAENPFLMRFKLRQKL